jgi:predicted MPP superfamily phosphohydrolase
VLIFDLIRPAATVIALRVPSPTLDVKRITFRLPVLPASLEGFTIAQVSDLHVGPGDWGPEHLDEAAAVLRREDPDIVVNTGDFLDEQPPLERVRELSARLTLPGGRRNFAVLGNHDYVAGHDVAEALKAELECAGIRVLENELICVRRGDAGITLGGLTTESPGWDRAAERLRESDGPRVVLIHKPDCARRLPAGAASLILAGHTHGGQITVPGLEPLIVRAFCGSRFVEGMYDVNGSPMYVNRGLGCVGLPMRFRANPELTFITLAR